MTQCLLQITDRRKQPGYNPKRQGEISAAQVMARCLQQGRVVLTVFGDSQRYDFVVDEEGDFIRVQAKTGLLRKDGKSFIFPCCSSNWNTGKRRDYRGDADVFGVYCDATDEVYIFDVETCPKKSCVVRLETNRRKSGAKRADDHLLVASRSLRDYS